MPDNTEKITKRIRSAHLCMDQYERMLEESKTQEFPSPESYRVHMKHTYLCLRTARQHAEWIEEHHSGDASEIRKRLEKYENWEERMKEFE